LIPEMTATRSAFSSVKSWEKLDQYTLKVYLDEQYFGALSLFEGSTLKVLPKHIFIPEGTTFTQEEFAKHFRDHPCIDKPVGTGPYVFPSEYVLPEFRDDGRPGWQPGTYVHVIRSGRFYDPYRAGYLTDIYWYIYPGGGEAILRAMNNGEVDMTRYLGSEEIFKKSNTPQFRERFVKVFFFGPNFGFFAFNMHSPYFSDKRVRRAFNFVVDRERFSKNVSYGIAPAVSGSQFNFGPTYNPDVTPYPYNPSKAEELLNEAGWVDTDGDGLRDKDGIPFEVELLLPPGKGTIGEGLGYMMQEDLEPMGVKLELRRLEWASLLEHIDDRKFDMFSLSFSTDVESDPFSLYHSSQWANKGQNFSGFANEEADRLILAIRRELNYERRIELHHKLHALLSEEVPLLYLYNYPYRGAYSRRLRNVKFSGKSPGYFPWQWYIPENLQTPEERERAIQFGFTGTPQSVEVPDYKNPGAEEDSIE